MDIHIEEPTLLASLVVKERTLLQLPTLLHAGREGIAHLPLLLDLADTLQLLRPRLIAHSAEEGTEDLDGVGDTGLWYRPAAACLSSMGWLIIFIMKMPFSATVGGSDTPQVIVDRDDSLYAIGQDLFAIILHSFIRAQM